MRTVRQIEAQLGTEVEDAVLGQLGYREYTVTLPDGTLLDDDSPLPKMGRPQVKQVDYARISEMEAAKILDITGGIPNDVFEVRISRQISEQSIRFGGFWNITHDTFPAFQGLLTSVTVKDAWFICRVAVIKNSTAF